MATLAGPASRRDPEAVRIVRSLLCALLLALVWTAPALGRAAPAELEQARTAFAESDYASAQKLLAALGPGAGGAEGLRLRAALELWTGHYAEAVETGRKVAAHGMDSKVAVAPWLAEALARQGKVDEAIKVLREVEKEPTARRARLALGELLIATGKRSEAQAPLMTLVQDYNADAINENDAEGLTLVARAAELLRSPSEANDTYNAAEKAGGKRRVETLLARGELFLDKYNPGGAASVVKDALKLAPNDPRAHVAMAHVKLEQAMDFAAAEQEINQALAIDPKLAGAFFVRAGLALRTMDLEAADAAADEGLKTNPRDLELLSIKAATRFLADDRPGFDELKKRVLGYNPSYSRFFLIVGEYAEWEHRYDDIVAMMREAVSIDPDDAKAYAALGLNLIRAGDEKAGLAALNKAWPRDKFNPRVLNTINLFEKTIPKQYVTVDGTIFRLRYPKAEQAILERYVPRMLEQEWASLTKRYGFKPPTPVSIELYADSQDFSIRTAGLPNVGIQGVCFGRTLAALGPSAGPFNWGMILWHELSHVFAITQSRSRVPRWFTEGLSEYETLVARPEWRRRDDLALYRGLRQGKIPKVAAFNRAFTHAEEPEDLTTAYFAASQIMVFLVEQFGFDKTVSALGLWAASKRTPEVVQTAFGVSTDELDRRFHAWLAPRLERYAKQYVPDLEPPKSVDGARKELEADPRNPAKLVKVALGMLGEGDEPQASATLALALSIDPSNADALYVSLRMAMRGKDLPRANELLHRLTAAGHDGYAVRMKAADVAELEKNKERLKAELWAAHQWDATQSEPLQGLYDLAHEAKDADGELEALRMLAAVDAHDGRVWKRLLAALVQKGRWEEARTVGESALYVAVEDPEMHRNYARALSRSGRFVSAIYELNSAIVAGAKPKDAAQIYRSMAEGYRKLGKAAYAAKAEELGGQMAARAERDKAEEPSDSLRGKGGKEPD